jgi:DNA polymerase V
MWKELKGESCIGVNELPGKKSICTSRSFGNLISDWDNLCESVVNFVVSCAEKLRRQHSVCKILTVFIMTSRFRADLPQYNNSVNIALPVATADTSELVKYAVLGLRSIYKGGYLYKKSGVVVSGISSDSAIEQDLFDFVDRSKQRSIINAIDTINSKHSKGALSLASQGVTQGHWGLKREYFSRCYSTNFNDIIEVKI